MVAKDRYAADDPLWYKDAIIYELHVKSFCDSTGDGIGDFRGLIEKLDYLQSLGISAVWLLPFYPSPKRDDGYDISDYFSIDPAYGTLADFREFLKEAHRHGIRVITELVVNHTSDQHPWFQRARRAAPGSTARDFYVWSDTPEKYRDARIIFKDFETSNWAWDPVAKAYYWHRFYAHQPDLNYNNPAVHKEIMRVVDFWLGMGVDGLRLDAVPYLYEEDGTNCENLPKTHTFLKKLRAHIDGTFKNRMLLSEANQWPEDAASYFGKGDECHMAFHFPVMPRLFMSLWMEDTFPIVDILEQTPQVPGTCQWAMFLRNHDELTLEMVTDEERDYMYRVYARDSRAKINLGIRRRLSPLLGNNRRKTELLNMLLFSLPGTPVIYYGDEVGMGDNFYLGDRDGVRTPMQWSADRNAGFSRANPQKLFLPVIIDPQYHYEAVNVESQEGNLSSLLWWMRRVISMRKRFKALGRGDITFIRTNNAKIVSFVREHEGERILVVANLSRFSQAVTMDLSRYAGSVPVEVFSGNKFPEVSVSGYTLTLGFHDYFWLRLRPQKDIVAGEGEQHVPEVTLQGRWPAASADDEWQKMAAVLPSYMRKRRWFSGKAKTIQRVRIAHTIGIRDNGVQGCIALIDVSYTEGPAELYQVPLVFLQKDAAAQFIQETPEHIIAHLSLGEEKGILGDGVYDAAFREALFQIIAKRRRIREGNRELSGCRAKGFTQLLGDRSLPLISKVAKTEQSNTSILYGDTFFMKLYRRLEEGINPDVEMGQFLTRAGFACTPSFAGTIELHGQDAQPMTCCLLQGLIPNQGDAWTLTLDEIARYYEQVLARQGDQAKTSPVPLSLFGIDPQAIPPQMQELAGMTHFERIKLLGERTAQLHCALASTHDPAFSLEPFSKLYQRSVYQSISGLVRKTTQLLGRRLGDLPIETQEEARQLLSCEGKVLKTLQKIVSQRISAMKIRIHGDFHLGQVLYTGKDFVIIDFEGEPARAMGERRLKRSALRDVAGMIRSFHYAAYGTLFLRSTTRPEDRESLEPWADWWYSYASGLFLKAYLAAVTNASFVPKDAAEFQMLLNAFIIEKAFYEVGYELDNRPDWVIIPLKGIQQVLRTVTAD